MLNFAKIIKKNMWKQLKKDRMFETLRDLKTLAYLPQRQRVRRTGFPFSQRSVLSKVFPLTRDAWHPQRIELYNTGKVYMLFHRLLRLLGLKS